MSDHAPDYPPRTLVILWAEGEDPKIEAPGFADWEAAALLREALAMYEVSNSEDSDAEP